MEDSHLARCLEVPGAQSLSLFGVFDGHGGAEVAKFCERYMVDEFLRLREEEADLGVALVKAFHRMDDMLRDSKWVQQEGSHRGDTRCLLCRPYTSGAYCACLCVC